MVTSRQILRDAADYRVLGIFRPKFAREDQEHLDITDEHEWLNTLTADQLQALSVSVRNRYFPEAVIAKYAERRRSET